MQKSLALQQLLTSEMTRAVLRADRLDPRDFQATLDAAARRLQRDRETTSFSASRISQGCAALPCFGA